MDAIQNELKEIKQDDFTLDFHYPKKKEAVQLAVSTDALYSDTGVNDEFKDIRAAVQKAKEQWEQLPLDLQRELSQLHGDAQ
ncbi:hypothetical protein GOZ90_27165 [Agrobacterium vitis]|uniref:Uncharacterized protein n=1 Tax=Agrobacterium vitis TaxID=373 RepID=A0A6L6VQB4_AGRVI|nr:hypothetical protein [Agrobacterium vitis]MUZ76297.1 hypothetical protein [Agrobacterium vitis]